MAFKGFILLEYVWSLLFVAIFSLGFMEAIEYHTSYVLFRERVMLLDHVLRQVHLEAAMMQKAIKIEPLFGSDFSYGMQIIGGLPAHHVIRWPDHVIRIEWHGFYDVHHLWMDPFHQQYAMNGFFLLSDPRHSFYSKLTLNRFAQA